MGGHSQWWVVGSSLMVPGVVGVMCPSPGPLPPSDGNKNHGQWLPLHPWGYGTHLPGAPRPWRLMRGHNQIFLCLVQAFPWRLLLISCPCLETAEQVVLEATPPTPAPPGRTSMPLAGRLMGMLLQSQSSQPALLGPSRFLVDSSTNPSLYQESCPELGGLGMGRRAAVSAGLQNQKVQDVSENCAARLLPSSSPRNPPAWGPIRHCMGHRFPSSALPKTVLMLDV